MNRLNKLFIGLLGGFAIASVLLSCATDADPNNGIIANTDSLQLRFTDTTTLIAFTEKDDTLRTDATERVLLGSYYDPIFGKTTASFYSTFTIAQSFSNTGGAVIDSVILTMKFEGGYGDLSKITGYQVLQVFEVTEEIAAPPTEGYNSLDSFDCNPTPLSTFGYAPQFFPLGTEPAALRVKLNPSFGNRFMTLNDTINNVNLRDYIKGIYVRIDPMVTAMQSSTQGGLAYFKLNSDVSHINVHYHFPSLPGQIIKLPMGTTSNRRINIFKHHYAMGGTSDPAFQAKLYDSTNTIASDKLYIQSNDGCRVKIKMPYLMNYLDSGKIIVNRAELVIPVDNTQDFTLYDLPPNVLTYTLGSDGKIRLMDDFYYTYYNTLYDPINEEYRVVFTQYLQQVLNSENISGIFYVDVPIFGKNIDAYRMVIHSAEHATKPLKLNLTYTRIPTTL